MRNKNVGYLILGVALLVGVMVFFFGQTAKTLDNNCPLVESGQFCPSSFALHNQMYISTALVGILIVIGLFFIFSKENERVIIKNIKQKQKMFDLKELNFEERRVFKLVQSEGVMFQADIIDKTGFGKAKVTRIIDRLEGKDFVERKRRGMNNLVALRD